MRPMSATIASRADENNPYLIRFIFGLFFVLVLARLFLNPNLVDMVENYTADQGSIIEKIHPVNYGFAVVALAALLTLRVEFASWELRIVRAFIALTMVIAAI